MTTKINDIDIDLPTPPITSSYYASKEDTEAYERDIAEIMARKKVTRIEAQLIYDSE